jgi:flagellar basal body rod protein FlgF
VTYVSEIAVNDAFIVVAANNTGTVQDMGLVATKIANSSYAGLRFDVASNAWQISSSVAANGAPITAYANISSGTTAAAGNNLQIQFNNSGVLGASGNLTFNSTTRRLGLSGSLLMSNTGTPTTAANSVVLWSNAVSAGGTGLYFLSNAAGTGELCSTNKAIVFGIIF